MKKMPKTILQVDQISRIKMHPQTPVKNVKFFREERPNWRNLWTENRDAGFYYVGGFSENSPIMPFERDKDIHVLDGDIVCLKPRVEFYMACGGREVRYFDTYDQCSKFVTWITKLTDKMFAVVEVYKQTK